MEAGAVEVDTVVADTVVAGSADEADAVAVKVDVVENGTVDAVDAAELAVEAVEAGAVEIGTLMQHSGDTSVGTSPVSIGLVLTTAAIAAAPASRTCFTAAGVSLERV